MCDHAYLLEGGRVVLYRDRGPSMIENEHVRRPILAAERSGMAAALSSDGAMDAGLAGSAG